MKTLYIVRHAKSSWDTPGLADHQRTLLEKGRKRTQYICNYLINAGVKPDLILSSHAIRAAETAKIIAEAINYPIDDILVTDKIYHSDTDDLFDLLFALDNDVESVMLVGHNPTLTYMANHFLDEKLENLPTSGVVCVEFETDKWEELFSASYKTKFVITPRLLQGK